MADNKINKTYLNELTTFSVDDLLVIEDISAGETKVIEVQNLFSLRILSRRSQAVVVDLW